MNKFVKILLVILAVLLIAGGGFWSGTRYAFSQTPAAAAQVVNAAPSAGPDNSANSFQGKNNRPGFDRQQDTGNAGPGSSNNDRQGELAQNQNRSDNRTFGPSMMPQNFPNGGMMMNRSNEGFGRMSLGNIFLGGGMMLFGLLFPLGFAILMVLGIIILFRMVRKPAAAPSVSTTPCANCGAALEDGWKNCPHCGTPI